MKSTDKSDETDEISDLPDRLTQFRARTGMSQPELAKRLHVSANYVYQLEKGRRQAGRELARAFFLLENSPVYRHENWAAIERAEAPIGQLMDTPAQRGSLVGDEEDEPQEERMTPEEIEGLLRLFSQELENSSRPKKRWLLKQIHQLSRLAL